MTINDVIDGILEREGGYVNRLADRGGPTYRGVTAAAWGEYAHLDREATPRELQSLTEEQVRAFYFDRHVGPYLDLPEPLRSFMADWSVHSWHDNPVKAFQVELSKLGLYKGKIDGLYGPQTKTAATAFFRSSVFDHRALYVELVKARLRFLVNLVLDEDDVEQFLKTHPRTQLRNLRGWVNRSLEFVI